MPLKDLELPLCGLRSQVRPVTACQRAASHRVRSKASSISTLSPQEVRKQIGSCTTNLHVFEASDNNQTGRHHERDVQEKNWCHPRGTPTSSRSPHTVNAVP